MPIYAYQCRSCGNEYDLKQGFDADAEHPCPSCPGVSRRRLALPAVIYKGSGFYTTDYARKGGESSPGANSAGGSSASSSASSNGSSGEKSESAKSSSESPAKAAAASD